MLRKVSTYALCIWVIRMFLLPKIFVLNVYNFNNLFNFVINYLEEIKVFGYVNL